MEQQAKRILLVGDSISNGYGGLLQKLMLEYAVDRLSTSEGTERTNYLRMLQIAWTQYDYELIHINNGIHVHGVMPEASQMLIELNDIAMQVCHGMHIPVNDLFEVCVSENLQKSDGVHFQESGYLRLAECVVKSIDEQLN